MPSKTYKTRALVVKKTKLGEKDLIVTMVDESGALVKGVAKGARRPGGSLAARIELFSAVDALMAKGRSLDVVCEARLTEARTGEFGLEQSACAAPIAELLCIIAQPDLAQSRIYDMSCAALARISTASDEPQQALAITAACLWKLMSQSGYRPSFSACALCGQTVPVGNGAETALSLVDGGVVCNDCPRPADAIVVSGSCIQWCETLIRSRYGDIVEYGMGSSAAFEVLHLVRVWIRTHTGRDLKSLDFLLTSGLF